MRCTDCISVCSFPSKSGGCKDLHIVPCLEKIVADGQNQQKERMLVAGRGTSSAKRGTLSGALGVWCWVVNHNL